MFEHEIADPVKADFSQPESAINLHCWLVQEMNELVQEKNGLLAGDKAAYLDELLDVIVTGMYVWFCHSTLLRRQALDRYVEKQLRRKRVVPDVTRSLIAILGRGMNDIQETVEHLRSFSNHRMRALIEESEGDTHAKRHRI